MPRLLGSGSMSSWPWVTVRWWGSFRSISIVSLVSQTWAAVLIARPPLPPPGLSPSFSLTPFPPPPLAGPTTGEAACDLARGGCSGLLSRARILANSVAGFADSLFPGLPPVGVTCTSPRARLRSVGRSAAGGLALTSEVGVLEAVLCVCFSQTTGLCPRFGAHAVSCPERSLSGAEQRMDSDPGPDCPGVCRARPGFWEAAGLGV